MPSAHKPAVSDTGDPLLLTPGPLTTGKRVKEVMVHDWGSRDAAFLKINAEVLARLPEIVNGGADYVTVPMQGSGTFAVEAMLTTFVPPGGMVLMLINGAYGQRARKILSIARREVIVHETPEDTPPDLAKVEAILEATPAITHVFVVHCETTSGILNPIAEIGALARKYRKSYLVDSMSAFGALALDARAIRPDAIAASSNKCIEGVPGVAFHQALTEFFAEGGQPGRGKRYTENCYVLIEGMRALGFEPLLSHNLQAPIIVTFRMPADPKFHFQEFYDRLKDRGYVIYPGKLTVADSFRIGCIGRLYPDHMRGALAAIRDILDEMGVKSLAPAKAA